MIIVILCAACGSSATLTPSGPPTPFILPTVTVVPWRPVSDPITPQNASRLTRVGSLISHTITVNRLSFAHNSAMLLSQDGRGLVIAWNLQTGQRLYGLSNAGAALLAYFSADDQQVVTVGFDNQIRTWKASDGSPVSATPGASSGITVAASSPDGQTLAVGFNDGTIEVWHTVPPRQAAFTLHGSNGALLRTLAFSDDNKRLVSIATDNVMRAWDAITGTALSTWSGFTSRPLMAALSPDGGLVAVAVGNQVHVYDTITAAEKLSLSESDLAGQLGMAFSPDGKLLAVGGSGDLVYMWRVADGQRIARLPGHDGQLSALSWSPDSSLLLTVAYSANGGTYLWNTQSFQPGTDSYQRGLVSAPGEPIVTASWSPNGKRIVTADQRGSMTIWGLPIQ
ncbi:MAG: WD40 repeat domain-containing protein [Aggregatilineales bacterium]